MRFECDFKVELPGASELLHQLGLDEGGALQVFHTHNVLRRIEKYMPKQSGMLIKLMQAQTDINQPLIVVDAPQAHYLYIGMLYVDPITGVGAWRVPDEFGNTAFFYSRPGVNKVPTETPLNYNTSGNALAGPQWDERLVAAEGNVMAEELQAMIDGRV